MLLVVPLLRFGLEKHGGFSNKPQTAVVYWEGTMVTRPGKHTKSDMENGPLDQFIVDLPIDSMVDFSIVM